MSGPGWIAEVSSNHAQDLARSLAFVDKAAALGCTAVKFQLFRIRELFAPEVLAASAAHRAREQWELDPAMIPVLAAHCREQGIDFSCTPFFLEAVGMLADHVAFFKIASYELLWTDLLRAVAETGKPVVLSTGMATLAEVLTAVQTLRRWGCKEISLLHCASAYPTPADQANLAAIATLRQATGCPIGWSDHTRDPAVLYRAVFQWQAQLIEFHLDLDGTGDEYPGGHCWLPEEIGPVIAGIGRGLTADGSGRKEPAADELADRDWRADPEDGLRPLKETRRRLYGS